MKAVLRVIGVWLTTAALAPVAAVAQQTAPTTNNQSATDAVGPRELQNFKLPGTVTRPSDQPAAGASPAARTPPPATEPPAEPAPKAAAPARRSSPTPGGAGQRPGRSTADRTAPSTSPAIPSGTPPSNPSAVTTPGFTASPTPAPSFPPAASSEPTVASPAGPAVPYYVWLLAALALGAGAAFLVRRGRNRLSYAGGHDDFEIEPTAAPSPPVTERVAAPVPEAVAPPPEAATPAAPPPVVAAPVGIVSTRLRPWVDFGFTPLRCTLDQAQAMIDFEIELFNSGSAPARGIVVAATAFNAGPQQDEQIANYFDCPTRQGHAIDALMPMERTLVPLQLAIPRDHLQAYELGGHQVFVPLLAANVTYAWGSGEGQSSASFLVGRGTANGKLSPFRIDGGSRAFAGLDAKPLPLAVRR